MNLFKTLLPLFFLSPVPFAALTASDDLEPSHGLTKSIVGGGRVPSGEYPWMCALVKAGDEIPFRGFFSGGTLIHPEWVLTAAHSVQGLSPSDIHVLVGMSHLIEDAGLERRVVSEILIHPAFSNREGDLGSDLALLRLEQAVQETATLPISLGVSSARPGRMTRALGWGLTANRGFRSTELRGVDLPVVDKREVDAMAIYGQLLPGDTVLAGLAEGGKDTCEGDSGGPLMARDTRRGEWRMLAVIAGGADLGCAIKGAYGVYTEVAPHLRWIESAIVSSYRDWSTLYGGLHPENDEDRDGFSNWSEYAQVSHPIDGRSQPRLAFRLSHVNRDLYPTIAGSIRKGTQDIQFVIERSEALNEWHSVFEFKSADLSSTGPLGSRFVWQGPIAVSETPSQYFHLRATVLETAPLLVLNPTGGPGETSVR